MKSSRGGTTPSEQRQVTTPLFDKLGVLTALLFIGIFVMLDFPHLIAVGMGKKRGKVAVDFTSRD